MTCELCHDIVEVVKPFVDDADDEVKFLHFTISRRDLKGF